MNNNNLKEVGYHPTTEVVGFLADGLIKDMENSKRKIKVVPDEELTKLANDGFFNKYKQRYVVIDEETGELLDDAQGYGYKDIQGAYKTYAYKQKVKNPKQHKKDIRKKVNDFISKNKDVFNDLEAEMFYAVKDGIEFKDKEIKKFLKERGIEKLPFTVTQILNNWR